MKRTLLSCFLLLFAGLGYGADTTAFREFIGRVNQAYGKAYPIRAQVQYNYYASGTGKPAAESAVFSLLSDGIAQQMSSPEIETLRGDSFQLFIHHGKKLVSIERTRRPATEAQAPFQLDSLLGSVEKIKLTKSGSLEICAVELKNSFYRKMEISVHASSYLIASIRFYAAADPGQETSGNEVIEVKMLSLSKNANIRQELDPRTYFTLDAASGKVTLSARLKNYQLLTPIIEEP
jgi:hypothetical protein